MFEPLLEDRSQDTLGALTGEIHGRATAERVIAELHQAGGVDVPREFVIMDRAAIGLSAVFLRLQAKVNWHRLFEELIAGFDPPPSSAARPRPSPATRSRCRAEPPQPRAAISFISKSTWPRTTPSLAAVRRMVGSDRDAASASARSSMPSEARAARIWPARLIPDSRISRTGGDAFARFC